MKLSGEHRYEVPQEELWKALLDPEILAGTLPGCEQLERTGENAYSGRLKTKVGPVQGVFEGTVELTNLDPPHGYDLAIDGRGTPGFMKGSGTLRLEPDGDDATVLHYAIDAQVGGRIASVGQRLVESSAKVITRQGLEGLERQLAATGQGESHLAAGSTDRVSAGAPPSQTELAGDFVKGLAGELVPKGQRRVLLAAAAMVAIVVVAVVLRACGGS